MISVPSLICLLLTAAMIFDMAEASKPCKGEWELIFHAPSGNRQSVLRTWKTKYTKCDIFNQVCPCPIHRGCLPSNFQPEKYTNPPRKILRSPFIDYWSCLNIRKVRFELNTRGKTVAFIEFDGRGSNSMNWFDKSRILKTSWTDMHKSGSFNFFSIDKETRYSRKFFINKNYGGCHRDAGWFVVSDVYGSKPCRWEKRTPYPQFLYSKNGKLTRWYQRRYGKAELLNIYIQRG
ncbi:uncharacterized protein LOC133192520 [Saccostrea echinata]|uniref:uncharacterized protein LOC133192520 n=1 Tax=Saccostrea echinata TaxID=191078 RepID=UPI002A82BB12|nr:uncharacterized protein LOC133192520 [Saccostrea echinata]